MTGNKHQKAFTFIESMIVITMIGILSIIIIPSYQSAKNQLALERAASKLAQDLREIQEMALSSKEIEGSVPEGGYGLYIRDVPPVRTSYVLFADVANNQKYDPGTDFVRNIDLEPGIKVETLVSNHSNIIFKPPDPEVYLKDNDGNDLGSEIIIKISLINDETKTKDIKINKVGLISID